jgi:hypothetical protein
MRIIFALLLSNIAFAEEQDLAQRKEEILKEIEGLSEMQKLLEDGKPTELDAEQIEIKFNALMNENDWI